MRTLTQQIADRTRTIQTLMSDAVPVCGNVQNAVAYIEHVVTPTIMGGIFALPAPSRAKPGTKAHTLREIEREGADDARNQTLGNPYKPGTDENDANARGAHSVIDA